MGRGQDSQGKATQLKLLYNIGLIRSFCLFIFHHRFCMQAIIPSDLHIYILTQKDELEVYADTGQNS